MSSEAGVSQEAPDTPAVRQYWAAKRAHPDCVVLFRMGDFFEIFGEDAERTAPILGVALTARPFGRAGRIAMCGVPHHSLEPYARKLLESGIKVAVCDQVEAAQPGKLVARRVVRVLTAGTLIEDGYLAPGAMARCVALLADDHQVGVAALDVSTGSCQLGVISGGISSPGVGNQLAALETAELLLPIDTEVPSGLPPRAAVSYRPLSSYSSARGRALVESAGAALPASAETNSLDLAFGALAAVADYCQEGELAIDPAFLRLSWRVAGATMNLDASTRKNLELIEASGGGASLFRLIDRTLTPLGTRRLRAWLQEPLTVLPEILSRQQAVAELARSGGLREAVRASLRTCRDLERLAGRCVHGAASPRDLDNLAATLNRLPGLIVALQEARAAPLQRLRKELGAPSGELPALLGRALVDDPPPQARDGGFIRPGFDEELDQIRQASSGAREYLSKLEDTERERTGIRSLRVGYNRVFGYYIEVRNATRAAIPPEYVRRQTLVGGERYVTPELKEHENVVLTARERGRLRELDCLAGLTRAVREQVGQISQAAAALAEVDALQGLAELGVEQGWVMPEIDEGLNLDLVGGRHPLVESSLGAGRFVPNDVHMDGESERLWLLTGPNMAGKSTFLRQVALICLLGQVGSMVPCTRAKWGLVDRIFTRVGAQDDIAAGRSTFMVEMEEMALILAQSTTRSVLILDEIGRGTSTYDGMSIAQAILEYLHDQPGMARRVLFATHYHELTALERALPALRNFRVEVVETDLEGELRIAFLHRIVAGGADRSYGINVAQLAGLPSWVLDRAAAVLAARESDRPLAPLTGPEQQLALPLTPAHPMMVELEHIEIDGMTPLEALQKIAEWQRQVGERS
ncbi:MAG TPA: DNA mismatch repair protein MutS [Candidatus Dormibacteraeota bacterium]|nr:DNA mismatch repair protein MutS [Candidatus Dormibacteraeota bacterium]